MIDVFGATEQVHYVDLIKADDGVEPRVEPRAASHECVVDNLREQPKRVDHEGQSFISGEEQQHNVNCADQEVLQEACLVENLALGEGVVAEVREGYESGRSSQQEPVGGILQHTQSQFNEHNKQSEAHD